MCHADSKTGGSQVAERKQGGPERQGIPKRSLLSQEPGAARSTGLAGLAAMELEEQAAVNRAGAASDVAERQDLREASNGQLI
jgi:hypothetical protein